MRSLVLAAALTCSLYAAPNPVTQAITTRYNSAKQNLIEAADAMPETDYDYQLTKEQRPFSGWIEHTAMGNYSFCSAIKSEATPGVAHAVHGLSKKAELVNALRQSFEYCDAALHAMDDQTAVAEKDGKYPVNAMVALIASLNEHYCNLVGYLRTKGITPPSSRPKK